MEKLHTFRFLILIFTVLGIILPSCDSDDNDITENITESDKLLIGTWRYDWGDDPLYEYTVYTFFDNGTGLYFNKGNGATSFEYIYDTQRQEITIKENEYNSYSLIVKSLTTSVLEIGDGSDDDDAVVIYRRTELAYDMLILGEWYLHVGVTIFDHERGTRVWFYADGHYEAKDYDPVPFPFTEYDTSFNNLKGRVTGLWSIKKDIISINGTSQIAGRYIIDGLVINGMRLIRADYPDEYPYLFGGWNNRGEIYQ